MVVNHQHHHQHHYILPLFLLLLNTTTTTPTTALNITSILSHYPDLSTFTTLLSTTTIPSDITHLTSITILAVPNTILHTFLPFPSSPPSTLPDILRYHILLQYLSLSDLHHLPLSGTLITTLFQTTGLPSTNLGSLNATFNPHTNLPSFHPPNNTSISANVISSVTTFPYNLSIFTVDSLLQPYGFDLTASETRPPPPGLNITRALLDGHDINVAASMLMASGVVEEFEQDEAGAGITLFVPTDLAFANLPPTIQLQSLSADKKALVLKFHVLHSYYPLGSLESIVNPVQPTLATEDNGAGSFTLNISRVNGSVAINTGIVQAVVTQTVFDQNPVAIFGVSSVLLPREIFGKGGGGTEVNFSGGGGLVGAQPPVIGPAPEGSMDGGYGGPSHLSSPPGFREAVGSDGVRHCRVMVVWCIGLLLCVLVLVLV